MLALKHVGAINKEHYHKTVNHLCTCLFVIRIVKQCKVQRLKYVKGLLDRRKCFIKLPEESEWVAYLANCLDKRQAWLKLYDCYRPHIFSAGTLTREYVIYMLFATGS